MPACAARGLLVALALSASGIAVTQAEEPGHLPTLTLPDGSTITLPRGTQVFGPAGEPPAAAPAPSAKQGPPDPAPQDAPVQSAAERRRQRIDELFGRLAAARDDAEAGAVTGLIETLWLQSGSPTADLLMRRAVQAVEAKDNKTASALLDKIIALRPTWAEGWNKRATVRYLDDDDAGSMADIGHVLALEPRHFGALSGMGFILHRNGDDKGALLVLRKAIAINPQQHEIKALIEELTPEVEGHDL